MEVLVAHATPEPTLLSRVLAPVDAAGYPVHPVKRLFKRGQFRARLDIRSMLVHVVDQAQPAEVLNLFFAPDVLQVAAASKNSKTHVAVATSSPLLLSAPLDDNLPGQRRGADSVPGGDSAVSLLVKENPQFGSVLVDGDW